MMFSLLTKNARARFIPLCRSCHSSVKGVRVRFAPSPTGQLHLGGLRTALYNYLFCKSHGGKFILRIEDTDQTRLVPGAMEQLVEMLEWSGLKIDEGPLHGGNFGPYIQSQRLDLYSKHLQTLLDNGTAYRCFCTSQRLELLRRHSAASGEIPKYDNKCRHLSEEEIQNKLNNSIPYVVRFKLEPHLEPWNDLVYGPITYDVANIEGDPILMKSDGYPTYHFANIVDDHLMQITHVLRGAEWQVSTTKHILLYKAFGWQPPQIAHLPLLQNKDGKKLSKRQNDVHVENYKAAGYFPEALLNLLTDMGSGFTVRDTAGMNIQQLISHFELSKLNTNSTKVDFEKLPEFNRLHLKNKLKIPDEKQKLVDILRLLLSNKYNQSGEFENFYLEEITDDYLEGVLLVTWERISLISDLILPEFDFLWLQPKSVNFDDLKENVSHVHGVLEKTIISIHDMREEFKVDSMFPVFKSICNDSRYWSFGRYMKVLRRAIGGPTKGPSVAELMVMLGKEKTLVRLKRTLDLIEKTTKEQTVKR